MRGRLPGRKHFVYQWMDPVVLDQSGVDLVHAAPDGKDLIARMESCHGIHTLEHGEAIGREYQGRACRTDATAVAYAKRSKESKEVLLCQHGKAMNSTKSE